MKRIIALILLVTMLASLLVACDKEPAVTTAPVESTPVTEESDAPEIPDEIDLSGEFHILVAGNMKNRNDFAAEDDTGTSVQSAIYRRNEAIKETYGVDVTTQDVTEFNTSNGGGPGFVKIYTDYMAGQSTYDAAMVGTYDVATLAYSGYIHDLKDLKYTNLSKEYWDQKANEDLTIRGKMFYTTGDISIVDNIYTHAMIFNKDLIESYGLENPYDLVEDNNWTLETFGTLVKQVGEDINQDGAFDENDKYGLLTWNDPMLAILASSGEKIAAVNENGEIELTFYNERVLNLYERFEDIVFDVTHAYNYQYDNSTGQGTPSAVWDTNRDAIFNSNRAVFYLNALSVVERHRDSEVDFGILPYPKLDASQEDYGHQVSAFHASFLCVPEFASDLDRCGAVIELLAYYGKQFLTPAYYEKTLYGQYVRDEESTEMLDIIFASRVFDVGIYYDIGTYRSQLTRLFTTRSPISSMYDTYKELAQNKRNVINNKFSSTNEN